ncbi:MAG: hypothetical protein KDK41_08485 [Leptospiraceae bacterium]|nr:hypothetical protein [Leptospiraceae bacterium]MCB1200669.1 hypothetical protein [Leptospiraceae bacterium]
MNLNQREKLFIIGGAVILIMMLAFLSGRYLLRQFSSLEEESISVEESLNQIRTAGIEYRLLQNYRAGGTSSAMENMVPFLENLINSAGIRDRLAGMSPRDTDIEKQYVKRSVFLTFRDIGSRELLELLKQIETNTSALYQVESFSVRPVIKKPGIFNASLTVAAFQKKSGEQ